MNIGKIIISVALFSSSALADTLTDFARDNNGRILKMNFPEAKAYCASQGLQLPTSEELIRAAEFSIDGIRETAFRDLDIHDPRVFRENEENQLQGFVRVINVVNGVRGTACYYNKTRFLRLPGDLGERETAVVWTSSKFSPQHSSAQIFYRPYREFKEMGLGGDGAVLCMGADKAAE